MICAKNANGSEINLMQNQSTSRSLSLSLSDCPEGELPSARSGKMSLRLSTVLNIPTGPFLSPLVVSAPFIFQNRKKKRKHRILPIELFPPVIFYLSATMVLFLLFISIEFRKFRARCFCCRAFAARKNKYNSSRSFKCCIVIIITQEQSKSPPAAKCLETMKVILLKYILLSTVFYPGRAVIEHAEMKRNLRSGKFGGDFGPIDIDYGDMESLNSLYVDEYGCESLQCISPICSDPKCSQCSKCWCTSEQWTPSRDSYKDIPMMELCGRSQCLDYPACKIAQGLDFCSASPLETNPMFSKSRTTGSGGCDNARLEAILAGDICKGTAQSHDPALQQDKWDEAMEWFNSCCAWTGTKCVAKTTFCPAETTLDAAKWFKTGKSGGRGGCDNARYTHEGYAKPYCRGDATHHNENDDLSVRYPWISSMAWFKSCCEWDDAGNRCVDNGFKSAAEIVDDPGADKCKTRYFVPNTDDTSYAGKGFCADPENMHPKDSRGHDSASKLDIHCSDTYGLFNTKAWARHVKGKEGNTLTQMFGATNGDGWYSKKTSDGEELLYCDGCLVDEHNSGGFQECWRLPDPSLRSGCRTYSGKWICDESDKIGNHDFKSFCYASELGWQDYTGPTKVEDPLHAHNFTDVPRCSSSRQSSRMVNTMAFAAIEAQKKLEGDMDIGIDFTVGGASIGQEAAGAVDAALEIKEEVFNIVRKGLLTMLGPVSSLFGSILEFFRPEPTPLSQQFEELVADMKTWTDGQIAEQAIKTYTENVEAFEHKLYLMMCIEKSMAITGECTTYFDQFKRLYKRFSKIHDDEAAARAEGATEEEASQEGLEEWKTTRASVVVAAAIRAKTNLQDVTNEIIHELESLVGGFENTFEEVYDIGHVHKTRLASLNHIPIIQKLGNVMQLFLASHEALSALRSAYATFSIGWESNHRDPDGGPIPHLRQEYLLYKMRTMHELRLMVRQAKRLMKASLRVRLNSVWIRSLHMRVENAWDEKDEPLKYHVIHDTCQMDSTSDPGGGIATIRHGERNAQTLDYKSRDVFLHKSTENREKCSAEIGFKDDGLDLCPYYLSGYQSSHGSGNGGYSVLKSLVTKQGSHVAEMPGYTYLKHLDGGKYRGSPAPAYPSAEHRNNWGSSGPPSSRAQKSFLCGFSYMMMVEERWWGVMNENIPLKILRAAFDETRIYGHRNFKSIGE